MGRAGAVFLVAILVMLPSSVLAQTTGAPLNVFHRPPAVYTTAATNRVVSTDHSPVQGCLSLN